MWGFTESQESVGVSPKMYEEFIFPYEKPIMDRFGLTCYGCCEPLHSRWNVVKHHHDLRRVSCSAWANLEKMAANLGRRFHPVAQAESRPSSRCLRPTGTRSEAIFATPSKPASGCRLEIIMKDNHTLAGHPEHATEWVRIAREEAGAA